MNNDKLFDYLVATDKIDEFLGYEIPQHIKNKINELVINYNNDFIGNEKVYDILRKISLNYKINYDLLINYFNEQL